MPGSGLTLANNYKIVRGQTLPETALADGNYPASGSYIDVSGYKTVDILIHLGTLANTVSFTVKESDSASGTLDSINATNCVHTVATDDDGQFVAFHIEVDKLSTDHHFLSVVVASAGSTTDYADIVFLLNGASPKPVSQATAQLPTASEHVHAG
jgi:hypothetical protein